MSKRKAPTVAIKSSVTNKTKNFHFITKGDFSPIWSVLPKAVITPPKIKTVGKGYCFGFK